MFFFERKKAGLDLVDLGFKCKTTCADRVETFRDQADRCGRAGSAYSALLFTCHTSILPLIFPLLYAHRPFRSREPSYDARARARRR